MKAETKKVSEKECWENLANAVVTQAFYDYKCLISKRKPGERKTHDERKLENFFLGPDVVLYTKISGKHLLDTAKRQVMHERTSAKTVRKKARMAAM